MATEFERGRFASISFAFLLVAYSCVISLGFLRTAMGQDNAAPPKGTSKPAANSDASATKRQASKATAGKAATAEDLNIREYVTLLRHNVRLVKKQTHGRDDGARSGRVGEVLADLSRLRRGAHEGERPARQEYRGLRESLQRHDRRKGR